MKFSRTQEAAKTEKRSKWDLIEAIALDAVDNDVPISGMDSRLAAKAALDAVGNEHAERTIYGLCMVAKFDHESTGSQRQLWRKYGWTAIRTVAEAGVTQDAAFGMLAGRDRLTFREIEKAVARANPRTGVTATLALDEALRRWVNRLDAVLTEGAELAERAYNEDAELSSRSELALAIYDRITERKIDAELRELMESESAR